MAIADRFGLPIAVGIASASPGSEHLHRTVCPSAAKHRWKVERLFAWLQNYRRLITRHERHAENFLGFVRLECISILLRHF